MIYSVSYTVKQNMTQQVKITIVSQNFSHNHKTFLMDHQTQKRFICFYEMKKKKKKKGLLSQILYFPCTISTKNN